MFMTDEMGEGSDVIPSPICICGVAGPALVSTRLQNTRGACDGDVCRRERYTRSPTGAVIRKSCKKLPSPERISPVSPQLLRPAALQSRLHTVL